MEMRAEPLHLVGGQRREGPLPGVAVLTPPLRPARGRETETFVMLLDLAEAPSRLYRATREAAAQAFWSSAGSATAALRRAVAAANQVLFHNNLRTPPQQRCYGALCCMAIQPEEIFLAQAGPLCAWGWCKGRLERFPQEDLPPLGMGAYAEVRVVYLPIQPGDTVVLATLGLGKAASNDAMQRVLSLTDLSAVLDGLEQVAADQTCAALIVRWLEAAPVAAAAPVRPRLPSRPPARPKQTPTRPAVVPIPEPALPEVSAALPRPADIEEELLAEPAATPLEEPKEAQPVPVPRPPPRPVRRPRRPLPRPRVGLGQALRRTGQWVAWGASAAGRGFRALFRRTLPGQERVAAPRARPERRAPPPENPRLLIGLALAVLVIVALITLLTWLSYGPAVRRSQALSRARAFASLAQQTADPGVAHSHWESVLTALTAYQTDPEASVLYAQAQQELDRLDQVVRVEPVLIADLGTSAPVERLVAQGNSLFALQGHEKVLSLSLAGEPMRSPPPVFYTGWAGGKQRATDLVDMAWNWSGGEWTASALVVLDTQGCLWVYDPAWPDQTECSVLGSVPGQSGPVAVATYEGRLYLLDPLANQIWRFQPRAGGYPDRAEPYFPTAPSVPLTGARSLAIDGNVYVLFDDGRVAKYFDAQPSPFQVTGLPAPPPHFADLTLDPRSRDGLVYLADSTDERLLVLDASGGFRAQLRAAPGVLTDLQALTLDEAASRIFVAAGGRLYALPLPVLP